MGKDIHVKLEIKKDKVWEPIEDKIEYFSSRSYRFFSILDDNFSSRGIPEELKGKKFDYCKADDFWEFDTTADWLFGWSYVSLKELKDYFDSLNKVTVSEEFLRIFFELGGELPEAMTLDSNGDGIYVEPLDEEDVHFRDFFIEGIKEIENIAKKYDVSREEIRMVFAFDW